MEPNESNGSVRLVPVDAFDGHEVVTVEIENKPHWFPRHIGGALGYHDDGRGLVDVIGTKWADEFTDADRVLVDGEQLAALKGARPDLVAPNTPSLMLLTESGVYLASILTRKPAGRALRRWLADVALPAWRAGRVPHGGPTDVARVVQVTASRELITDVVRELTPIVRSAVVDELRIGRVRSVAQARVDVVRRFLAECVLVDPSASTSADELFKAFWRTPGRARLGTWNGKEFAEIVGCSGWAIAHEDYKTSHVWRGMRLAANALNDADRGVSAGGGA